MSRDNFHPDTELLDELRAGLLDDDPARKRELERHLADCPLCQQRHNWAGGLAPGALPVPEPTERLDAARRQAIRSAAKGAARRFIPFAVAAAAALVAVLLVKPVLEPDAGDTRLASNHSGEVPELYEDLDFYLWLADHKAEKDSRS
jgi:hypothetical protein